MIKNSTSVGTITGGFVDFANPSASKLDLVDIATGLSHLCRFAGQVSEFYSVAQHSTAAARIAYLKYQDYELAFRALLHDASEAYTGDCPRPLKEHLGNRWRDTEDLLQNAIFEHFGLKTVSLGSKFVKEIDNALCYTEHRTYQPNGPDWGEHWGDWDSYLENEEFMQFITPARDPVQAKLEFLLTARGLYRNMELERKAHVV